MSTMKTLSHKQRVFFLLLFMFMPFMSLQAQSSKLTPKDAFYDAEYYLMMGDYKEALPLYKSIYESDSTNYNINYRIGQCYLNLPGRKEKSVKFLNYAINGITPKYREGSHKETKAPNMAIFELARACMVCNQLDRAIQYFNEFKKTLDAKDSGVQFIEQQITACNYAKQIMKTPLSVNSQTVLSSQIANKSCLYPILSGDNNTLVFTSKEKFYDAIYYCHWDGEKWGTIYNATLDLALEGEIYATSLNYDGTKMLIFHNAISSGSIYSSTFANGKWSKAQKVDNEINSKNWETFASLSHDENTIVFTSNRKGGMGGLDIYMAKKQANGNWGKVTNMGRTINTQYNEESPVLSADGKTLYFASQGHNSIGGFDIFVSKLVNDSIWSNPYNIGYPINTTDDELFLFPIDSASALISTINSSNSTNYEISKITYHAPKPAKQVELIGSIIPPDYITSPSSYHITITNADKKVIVDSTASSYTFRCILPPDTYTVDIKTQEFQPLQSTVLIPTNISQTYLPADFQLTSINDVANSNQPRHNTTVQLNNILFAFDSYAITPKAASEIDIVYNLMKDNTALKLAIIGHTDSKGSPAYNLNLSKKRAESVVNLLTSKGIAKDRFETKSLGSIANISTNTNEDGSDNPEGRKYNRCVTIKVLNPDAGIELNFAEVPEHLKPANHPCTIILDQQPNSFKVEDIAKMNSMLGLNIKQRHFDNNFFLCTEPYKKKNEAVRDLSRIIDLDFPNAYIANEAELMKLCSQ